MATGGAGSKFTGAGADEVEVNDAAGAGIVAATRAGAGGNSWLSCAAAGSLKNASMAHAMANFTRVSLCASPHYVSRRVGRSLPFLVTG
jgi:hypothetical protein